jgi:hypothetical protein
MNPLLVFHFKITAEDKYMIKPAENNVKKKPAAIRRWFFLLDILNIVAASNQFLKTTSPAFFRDIVTIHSYSRSPG